MHGIDIKQMATGVFESNHIVWKAYSLLELFNDTFVNFQAKILHTCLSCFQYYWSIIVRQLTLGFGVSGKKFHRCEKSLKEWVHRRPLRAQTHIRVKAKYSHIFSKRSSKFHLWCADMGTQ